MYNGGRQDIWKFYYDTGEIKAIGAYEDNMKVGPWEYFYKNGQLKESGIYIYMDGKIYKRNTWLKYDELGKLKKIEYPKIEKSLDSFYLSLGWQKESIPNDIKNAKDRWFTPMQEYKAAKAKRDSLERLKGN